MSMKPALLFSVISLWCLTGPAAESMAQQQAAHGATAVVQLSYYAVPGKEQEVLSVRLSACDVLEKNGVTRGRVLTRGESSRETKNADNPDVVWEGEFPDEATIRRDCGQAPGLHCRASEDEYRDPETRRATILSAPFRSLRWAEQARSALIIAMSANCGTSQRM
jgi:hypothetical protein